MLIKNGRMIMGRILKPLQLKIWIRRAPAAVFLGSCALLFGAPLYAQDLLLKEYIYLDGKLLAVERQVLTQAAQQPASDSGNEMKFAQYSPSGIHGLTPPRQQLQIQEYRELPACRRCVHFIARFLPSFHVQARDKAALWGVKTSNCDTAHIAGIGRLRESLSIKTEGTMTDYKQGILYQNRRTIAGQDWALEHWGYV